MMGGILLAALLLIGLGGDQTYVVSMKSMKFNPQVIEIKVGDTVEWMNEDPYYHTVTSGIPGKPDGKFDSGMIHKGKSFSFTFHEKGEFNYFCRPHRPMKGKVIVR